MARSDVGEGETITYNSTSWGRCVGTVLQVDGDRVLVQDHHEHGAREWIPAAWVVVEDGPQDEEVD